jgi:recombination protein RecA
LPRKNVPTIAQQQTAQQAKAQELIAAINKQFGDGAITTAADPDLEVRRNATGVLPIDDLLDGGIPRGRMVEIYGPYSTLKSYVLYRALASAQQRGQAAALVDTEHSFDPDWATSLGVDVPNLLVSRPKNAEQGIGVCEALVRQKFDMVGFDSIASAIPKQHQEVAPGEDTQPGALARVMSKGLARLTAANSVTSMIFLNQTRSKIGVTFGSPTTTSGGHAMGFYASYRMSFTRIGKVTEPVKKWDGAKWVDRKNVVAHQIQVTLEKSKLSAPYAECLFNFDLRTGQVDDLGYLLAKALEKGVVTRGSAGHFDIPGLLPKPIHGAEKFRTFLDGDKDVQDYLKQEVLSA